MKAEQRAQSKEQGVQNKAGLSLRAERSNLNYRTVKNDQGFVLVVALLALLVVTVLGVLALSTSTTEVMVSGNARLREMNLATADAAVNLSEPVMRNPDKTKYTFLTTAQEQNLQNEIYCKSLMNIDTENFSVPFGDNIVSVDIDTVNVSDPGAGYALEGEVTPVQKKMYIINSTSTSGLGAENVVGAVYYIVGYCE